MRPFRDSQTPRRVQVRLGSYASDRLPPPAAIIGMQQLQRDPRSEPLYGERIPYVVCNTFSSRLVDMLQHPRTLLAYRGPSPPSINATYYITRQIIPALGRLFCLVGVPWRSVQASIGVLMKGAIVMASRYRTSGS